jgi:hypothetical protein
VTREHKQESSVQILLRKFTAAKPRMNSKNLVLGGKGEAVDIIVYSDTLEEHKTHVNAIIDILNRETLYLSETKLHFFSPSSRCSDAS